MNFARRTVSGAVATLILSALVPSMPAQMAASNLAASGDNTCWNYKSAEKSFSKKINFARGAVGIAKLSLDPELSKAARKHTKEMVSKDLLHHTSSDNLKKRVTHWSSLGENVGVGSTVASLHEAFMASPGHKENILYSGFKHVGIGVKKANGRMWVTVIFESAADPGTTLKMPSC